MKTIVSNSNGASLGSELSEALRKTFTPQLWLTVALITVFSYMIGADRAKRDNARESTSSQSTMEMVDDQSRT